MGVDTVQQNCPQESVNVRPARLNFFLASAVTGGTEVALNAEPVNACDSPIIRNGVRFQSILVNRPVLYPAATPLYLRMRNLEGRFNGNDGSIDNVALFDVTPQLDVNFAPQAIDLGAASTLTFTLTNTQDLLAKPGLSFTETLPNGLTVASNPAYSNSCADPNSTGIAAGATSFSVSGSLPAGESACTITVSVIPNASGTFTTGAGNLSNLVGLSPPARMRRPTQPAPLPGCLQAQQHPARRQRLSAHWQAARASCAPSATPHPPAAA